MADTDQMTPMRFIIEHAFRMDGKSFAARIGKGQSIVWRWQNDKVEPRRNDMEAIRKAALEDGIEYKGEPWSDSWFYEVPASFTPTEEAD